MRLAHRELARLETACRLNSNLFDSLSAQAIFFAVLVSKRTTRIVERFQVNVSEVRRIVRAHPPAVFVVAHIRQRKTKTRVTGEVPTFITMNVTFVNLARTEEGKMRIDKKHCVTACASGWTNNPTI